MSKIYLLFGGNLGYPVKNIKQASLGMERHIGIIIKTSAFFESKPWGFKHDNDFINQLVVYKTLLSPFKVLEIIRKVELELGRHRKSQHYEARTIDIDILFYDNEIIDTKELIIPHPKIQERRFTLEPLFEIVPGLIHPVLNISIKELLEKCQDKLMVKKLKMID